jgi:hypothetical protein
MSFHSFDYVDKKNPGGFVDRQSLSEKEHRRFCLKHYKEWLLLLADRTLTSDADLQRLMQTEFAKSIGPRMRALFPPLVTSALQPLTTLEQQYRVKLNPDEEREAIAATLLPPPHDLRDTEVVVGAMHNLHRAPVITAGALLRRITTLALHRNRFDT